MLSNEIHKKYEFMSIHQLRTGTLKSLFQIWKGIHKIESRLVWFINTTSSVHIKFHLKNNLVIE